MLLKQTCKVFNPNLSAKILLSVYRQFGKLKELKDYIEELFQECLEL